MDELLFLANTIFSKGYKNASVNLLIEYSDGKPVFSITYKLFLVDKVRYLANSCKTYNRALNIARANIKRVKHNLESRL